MEMPETAVAEEWRAITGYENLYEVSSLGNVKSFHSKNIRVLKPKLVKGYRVVTLCKVGLKNLQVYIGRTMLEAFKGPQSEPEMQADHRNRIKTDDVLSNLRWATPSENSRNQKNVLGSKSGVHGVQWNKLTGKWRAMSRLDNKQVYLGYFNSVEEAALAVSTFNRRNNV